MVAECLIFLFKFRKLFLLHLLACFRDFPLEIPLAHCVRGGISFVQRQISTKQSEAYLRNQ